MTTRPIELGLTRNPDGQSPSPWQIHIVATILGGLGAWTADPDSPRTADFQTRVERLRKTLVAGMSSHELSDTVERVLQLCDIYFEDTRTIISERERELTSVVQVLRETLADLAGQAKSFNVDLMRSTDRIGTLANVDDIRELKRLIASEARELKHAVVEKQRRDDVLFTQMSKRVDALQTQLAEAQKQAELDALTEIANRRGFDRTIKEWSLLASRSKQPFSMAIVDIDDFKKINDSYGHQVGDRVLRIAVFGTRIIEWDQHGRPHIGAPAPFTEIPLGLASAYSIYKERHLLSMDDLGLWVVGMVAAFISASHFVP
jgi:hypothetical protein